MMVAIPTAGKDLMADVEQRFGRCPRFLIVNSETMEYRSIPNAAAVQSGGAGIAAAQQVIDEGAKFVIAGEVGPNAFEVLDRAGIKVYGRVTGTIRDAVEMLVAGTLRGAMEPTGPALHGGRGMGRRARGP
jgi:predicted Fe-Mo cluster-binding NifX family protein